MWEHRAVFKFKYTVSLRRPLNSIQRKQGRSHVTEALSFRRSVGRGMNLVLFSSMPSWWARLWTLLGVALCVILQYWTNSLIVLLPVFFPCWGVRSPTLVSELFNSCTVCHIPVITLTFKTITGGLWCSLLLCFFLSASYIATEAHCVPFAGGQLWSALFVSPFFILPSSLPPPLFSLYSLSACTFSLSLHSSPLPSIPLPFPFLFLSSSFFFSSLHSLPSLLIPSNLLFTLSSQHPLTTHKHTPHVYTYTTTSCDSSLWLEFI